MEGTYDKDLHKMVFPIERMFTLRNTEDHRRHQQASTYKAPLFGIKGMTPLSSILTLPSCVPYDVMHLVYLTTARNLLTVIVEKKLVDINSLSSLITVMKVPHWFRRRPRRLDELCLWKSQEHKLFLLYFSPFCFYSMYKDNITRVGKQLAIVYLLFSSFMCALSSESIGSESIRCSRKIIFLFQTTMKSIFGAGVLTGSLHALHHLPSQVENFGSLPATSATVFENVNRFLKRSVTGKKRQGKQIVHRFLQMQMNATAPKRKPHVEILRFCTNDVGRELEQCFSIDPVDCRFISKVRVGMNVFHSYVYGNKFKSASHYAYLDLENEFVKLKSIFVHNGEIKCLCRTYLVSEPLSHRFIEDLPSNFFHHLKKISYHFFLRKSDLKLYPVNLLSRHSIVTKASGEYFGVKVIQDNEHE